VPSPEEGSRCCFFLCGKKKWATTEQKLRFEALHSDLFFSTSYSPGVWQKRNPYFTRCLPVSLIHLHYLKPLPALEQERPRSLSTLNPSTHLQPLVNSTSNHRTERNLKNQFKQTKMYDGVGATKYSSELPHRNNYLCEMGILLSRVS
jgi:hypothetical protein